MRSPNTAVRYSVSYFTERGYKTYGTAKNIGLGGRTRGARSDSRYRYD